MAKKTSFDDAARSPIAEGVKKLSRAVKSTLGPRGRNVVLDKGWGAPKVTKDGVTVAEDIVLDDPEENLGAALVKQAASKTNQTAGDGTTTATVLAEAIFLEGLKMVAAGSDPMALSRGIQKAAEAVGEYVDKLATPVNDKSRKEIAQVASIAGNNDSTIGQILADAFLKVGKNGVITIDEGKSFETYVDVVEGMQFDRGYLSPNFVTNIDDQKVEFDDPLILVFEDKISNAKALIPLLEAINKQSRPLFIVAEDVEGEALATLVVNKLRGVLQVCAVKAPGYGERRKAMLGDIAVLTGATAVYKDLGVQLDSVQVRDLGRAKKIIVTSDSTTIVGGAGRKEDVEARVNQIRAEIETTTSSYDKEKLQERLAKLAGGVARINVGAATESELKERKYLYEDAQAATKAALEEGVVPGGGVALLRAADALTRVKDATGDEVYGVQIVKKALEAPIREIAKNAGVEGSVVVNRVRKMEGKNDGYDADKDAYCDLIEAGVIGNSEGREDARARSERDGRHGRHGWILIFPARLRFTARVRVGTRA